LLCVDAVDWFLGSLAQRDAITHRAHSTIHVVAATGVIDAIAVADIKVDLVASAGLAPTQSSMLTSGF
jgi:hypothetical protein